MSEFDVSKRFTIENAGARGEVVRLRESYQAAYQHIDYPATLKSLLGEALCAAVLLSATIKFEGKLSLQLQGEGNLRLLLVQATHDRQLRGLIKWQGDMAGQSFRELIGKAQLAITIEPDEGQRYQGIVPLEGDNLAECLEHYFLQSEQLPTEIQLTADGKIAAGFLLQKLPGHEGEEKPEDWEHFSIFAKSITNQELLELAFDTLLYRLFHSEKVIVYDAKPVSFQCVCSKERCKAAVVSLGKTEIEKLLAQAKPLTMNCEFCGAGYEITLDEIKRLLS
jgi:molecular chaperone Hsp33